jgi:hypothetical protein
MRCLVLIVFLATSLVPLTALAADFTCTPAPDFSAWVINGQSNPTLTLQRGQTYTFSINAPGHPFDIKTAQVTGTLDQYNDAGVSMQGVTNGTMTFAVSPFAPNKLFYQCEVHQAMTGPIQIVPATPAPATGRVTLALLGLALCVFGIFAHRIYAATPARERPAGS